MVEPEPEPGLKVQPPILPRAVVEGESHQTRLEGLQALTKRGADGALGMASRADRSAGQGPKALGSDRQRGEGAGQT